MSTDSFKRQIRNVLTAAQPNAAFEEAAEAIRKAAEAIEESGVVQGAQVRVEPGHLLKLGQQLNVVITVHRLGFREVLFRAYVPENGFPVSLDFFGEQPVPCRDRQELEAAIVRLLQDRNVTTRLTMIQ